MKLSNFLSRFKRKPVGYLILLLNTGYEIIPNVRCQIGQSPIPCKEYVYENYWYKCVPKRIIPIYKKDKEKLKEKGYDIDIFVYRTRLGYDEWLDRSKRRIIEGIEKHY